MLVLRFEPSRKADFFCLHGGANGSGWCHCAAWWVPTWNGWGERTAADNRAVRESLCDRGEWDGYLAYDAAGSPIGWCQAGPRDRLGKLVLQYGLAPDPRAWALTCLFVAPSHRRRGVARDLVRGAVADIRRTAAAARIEAFPRRPEPGTALPEPDAWTGTVELFVSAGFAITRDHPRFPLMVLDLAPA